MGGYHAACLEDAGSQAGYTWWRWMSAWAHGELTRIHTRTGRSQRPAAAHRASGAHDPPPHHGLAQVPLYFLLFLVGYICIPCLILHPQNSGLFQLSTQLDGGGLPYTQGQEEKEGRLTVGGAG